MTPRLPARALPVSTPTLVQILAALLVLAGGPASAEEAPDPVLGTCLETAADLSVTGARVDGGVCAGIVRDRCMALQDQPQTMLALTTCAGEELAAWKGILDRAQAGLLDLVPAGEAAALGASIRAWEAYLEAECAREALQYAGGSMAPLEETACRARLTGSRARDLWSDWHDRSSR